jgi:hypothetical protein
MSSLNENEGVKKYLYALLGVVVLVVVGVLFNPQYFASRVNRIATSAALSFYKMDESRRVAEKRSQELIQQSEAGEIVFDLRSPLVAWAKMDTSKFYKNCLGELAILESSLPKFKSVEWKKLTEDQKNEFFGLIVTSLESCGSAFDLNSYQASLARLIEDKVFYIGHTDQAVENSFRVMFEYASEGRALTLEQAQQYVQFIYMLLNSNTTIYNILAFHLLIRIHERAANFFGPFETWLRAGRLSQCLGSILALRAVNFITGNVLPDQIALSSFNEIPFAISSLIKAQKGYAGGIIDWSFVFEALDRVSGVESEIVSEIRKRLTVLQAEVEQKQACDSLDKQALEDQDLSAELVCEDLQFIQERIWKVVFAAQAAQLDDKENYVCQSVEELKLTWKRNQETRNK